METYQYPHGAQSQSNYLHCTAAVYIAAVPGLQRQAAATGRLLGYMCPTSPISICCLRFDTTRRCCCAVEVARKVRLSNVITLRFSVQILTTRV